MYFKIALKNIKKSYKDYAIYFLTLILAICIFYSFNSIDSQKAFIDIKSSNIKCMSKLTDTMSFLSVVVSIILGSLILYANNFMIKKRKKELAIYMTLGMGKRKVSGILVRETTIVGVVSLIFGLLLGTLVSQALSVFTLKLFDIGLNEYRFAVSANAICKTILYFGIMFLLVMIFNVFVISRYKIIDLLKAGRKNENIKFKSPFAYLLLFILCVITLIFAYKSILSIGLDTENPVFKLSIVLVILCTIVFFFSLTGFVLYVVNKNKKVYFKGLNIFVIKQISSKINTNFLSMSLTCLMLCITITVLSTGICVKTNYEAQLNGITPFDASMMLYENGGNKNIEDILNKINFKTGKNEKCASCNEYVPASDVNLNDLFKTGDKSFKGYTATFIKISDYNKMMKLRGKKEIKLNDDDVLILSNYNKLVDPINENLKNSNKVYIKGKEYSVKNHNAIEENLETDREADDFCTIVINDKFLSNYKIYVSLFNVMYLNKNRKENDDKYDKINRNSIRGEYKKLNISIESHSKDSIYSESKRGSIVVLFVGIYLGLVFLITSMAVLAIQQLSDASDSIERYRALERIGANKKMIYKTIFIQILTYFGLPVTLALVHSLVGIKVIGDFIYSSGQKNIGSSALITALIFIAVYAGYFYTTYMEYKNIVKSNI